MERGDASHGETHDMRLLDLQVIEDGLDVVRCERLRIGSRALRHVRGRIASGVEGDATIEPGEAPQLGLPTSQVAREFVHEDHRPACSGFLIVEADAVGCGRAGHIGDYLAVDSHGEAGHRFAATSSDVVVI